MTNKQMRAQQAAQQAVKNGTLTRPDHCELCGRKDRKPSGDPFKYKSLIVAHHHRGYDHPLDVWFICAGCNVTLKQHINITKDQAIEFIEKRQERSALYLDFRVNGWFTGESLDFDEWLTRQGRLDLVKPLDAEALRTEPISNGKH